MRTVSPARRPSDRLPRPATLPSGALICITAGVAMLLSGCSGDQAKAGPPPPTPVKIVEVGPQAGDAVGYAAVLRASRRADLSFTVAGRLTAIDVEAGDPVRPGQVLARMDAAPFTMRLAQARAELARAAATAADAQRERATQAELAAGDATSRRALERAEATAREQAGAVQAAQAGAALAARDRAATMLRAPFAGRVASREVEPGAEIAGGTVVIKLDGGGAREAVALVPADRAAAIRPGQSARVRLGGDRTAAATIVAVGGQARAGGAVEVVARLAGEADLPTGIAVRLILPDSTTARDGPITVPAGALRLEPNGTASVMVTMSAGRPGELVARRRPVRLAAASPAPGQPVAIAAGLAPGDRIVAAGVHALGDGQRVTPLPPRSE